MTEDQKQNLLDIISLSECKKTALKELIDKEESIYSIRNCPALFLLEEIELHGEDEEDYDCLNFNLDDDWLSAAISYVKQNSI